MLATVLVAVSVERANRVERRLAATERVAALGQDLERRTAATQAYLISGAALFGSGIEVNQAMFDRFASNLHADKDFQGILALGWIVRLPADQVTGLEHSARREGSPEYRVWPKLDGSVHSVDAIKFIAPISSANRGMLGYNMQSDAGRRAAINRAEQTGRSTITGIVRLLRDGKQPVRAGFLMFAPVFGAQSGARPRGAIKGFVYGALRADDFIKASVLNQAADKLDIQIYDETETPSRLLFQNGQMIAEAQALRRKVSIADHAWIIKSSAAPMNVLSQTSMLILLSGLIIASLLLFIVRLAIQQALYDRQQLLVRQEQDAIRATLTRELNHRVKNTLANVLSILALSRRNAKDLDSFVETFDGRVRALSATHNLLMQSSWGLTSIIEIIRTEVAPYFGTDRPRIALEGPDAVIAPNDALSLGLLIHELVTNAAKFGALSNDTGTVSLTWTPAQKQQIRFEWREDGGPPPPADRQRGFGSDLIEKVISRELRSDIKLEFTPSGVRCTFLVPVRQVSPFSLKQNS